MNKEKHKKRHKELHKYLDELIADFIIHNDNKFLNNTTIMELMKWSYQQTQSPTKYEKTN